MRERVVLDHRTGSLELVEVGGALPGRHAASLLPRRRSVPQVAVGRESAVRMPDMARRRSVEVMPGLEVLVNRRRRERRHQIWTLEAW